MSDEIAALGEQLKEARQRKGLSAQKAADAMHLDAWVVDALESGDYARIGPAVYAKGHLRRYAQLLGVPAAEILEAYGSANVVPPTPAVQPTGRLRMPSMPGRDDRTQWWFRASGIIATAAVLAALLWWRPWAARSARIPAAGSPAIASSSARVPSGTPVALPAPNSNTLPSNRSSLPAVQTTAAAPSAGMATGTPSAAPVTAGRSLPSSSAETPSLAAAGHARLRFRFAANSWVEVRDAAGHRLFSGKGRANTVRSIAGDAPMKVFVRSPNGVQLEVNGHAAAIRPELLGTDGARFEAGADGVLRRDPHETASAARPRG